jgi:hypothetical protein
MLTSKDIELERIHAMLVFVENVTGDTTQKLATVKQTIETLMAGRSDFENRVKLLLDSENQNMLKAAEAAHAEEMEAFKTTAERDIAALREKLARLTNLYENREMWEMVVSHAQSHDWIIRHVGSSPLTCESLQNRAKFCISIKEGDNGVYLTYVYLNTRSRANVLTDLLTRADCVTRFNVIRIPHHGMRHSRHFTKIAEAVKSNAPCLKIDVLPTAEKQLPDLIEDYLSIDMV